MYYVYVYKSYFGDYYGSTKHPYLRPDYGYTSKFGKMLYEFPRAFERTFICETPFKDVALLIEDYFMRKDDTVEHGFNSRYNFKKKPTREEYEDAFGNISLNISHRLNKEINNPIYPSPRQVPGEIMDYRYYPKDFPDD